MMQPSNGSGFGGCSRAESGLAMFHCQIPAEDVNFELGILEGCLCTTHNSNGRCFETWDERIWINGADHHRDRPRHSHQSLPIIDLATLADHRRSLSRSISPRSSPIIDLAMLITDHQPRHAHRSSPIIAAIDLATLIADHHRDRPRHVVTHSADLAIDHRCHAVNSEKSPIIDLAMLITDHQPRHAHRSSPIIAAIDLATLIADHHRDRPRHVVTHSADLAIDHRCHAVNSGGMLRTPV
nr:hypothetical protein CFP56_24909 [Quercus suber]